MRSLTVRMTIMLVLTASFVRAGEVRQMPLSDESSVPRDHLAIGINYTGAQLRWNLSRRWAMEGRYQEGKSSSNYGDVKAHVFGARLYRLRTGHRFPFYWGAEMAYATAKPEMSNYKTSGLACGAFGGVEYRVTRWLWIDADMGPYVISLEEKQTKTKSTNLDFVLNTALIVRIF